jgi:hypothetical protein
MKLLQLAKSIQIEIISMYRQISIVQIMKSEVMKMTKEEIIDGLYRGDSRAIKEAIEALEQQPSDDCVSRQAVIDLVNAECVDLQDGSELWRSCVNDTVESIYHGVKDLPTVTPTQKVPREDMTEDEVRINMLELALNQAKEQAESIEVLTDNHRLIFKAEKRGNEE